MNTIKRDRKPRFTVDDEPMLAGCLFESKAEAMESRETFRLQRAFWNAGLQGREVQCNNPAFLFASLLVENKMLRKGAVDKLLAAQAKGEHS